MKKVISSNSAAGLRGRVPESATQAGKNKINEQISTKEVRVIDSLGVMLGIMPTSQALAMAEEKEMDLIEISPNANPPVVKIMDSGKYQYELQKKEKHARKQQQQQQMKEIRFKWRTATHDFNFKMRHARDFIAEGNKVKATVMFRGREITHQEVGHELLVKFVAALEDIAKVDQQIHSEGKMLSVVMAPDKLKKTKSDKDPE